MSPLFGSSQGILDTVVQFFKEDNWKYRQLEGKSALRLGFQGDNGSWNCYAQAREEHQQFVFYSVLDTNVPQNKRAAVAEFLTRANYGLFIGNFEMDYSDGEVRYKTSITVKGDRLTTALVKNLIYINVIMMDKYFPGIMSVVYAGTSPADAIAEVEG
jgi:hypothetical protein